MQAIEICNCMTSSGTMQRLPVILEAWSLTWLLNSVAFICRFRRHVILEYRAFVVLESLCGVSSVLFFILVDSDICLVTSKNRLDTDLFRQHNALYCL